MRNQIIEAMTRDLVDCTFETFADHYLSKPNEGLVDTVLAALDTVGVLEKRPTCDVSRTSPSSGKFAQHSFATGLKQTTAHGLFADTAEKIMDTLVLETKSKVCEDRILSPSDELHKNRLFSRSDRRLASAVSKSDYRVDACLLGNSYDARIRDSKLGCHQILVPFHFDRNTEENNVVQIREELLLTANLIMNGDARRTFLYGVTTESDRVSVWYFSHNHSVKADSFSFVERPGRLIHLLISLFSANDEALGLDPNIVLYPKASSGNPSYIYRFSNGSVDGHRFFKTTGAIGDHTGSLRVSGHMSRVWKAIEIANFDGEPLTGNGRKAEGVVIKDVWIDATAETEKEIQDKIFKSINEFVEGPEPWRDHPCLAEFTPSQFSDLESLVANEHYQARFLRIRDHYHGPATRPVAKNSRSHDDSEDSEDSEDSGDSGDSGDSDDSDDSDESDDSETREALTSPQRSSGSRSTKPSRSALDEENERIQARFLPKKRCFFMFDEFCTRVSHLPTFGDAVDILRQASQILLLMFCSGWVHRDISTGNVLALKEEGVGWILKLADLEYAEEFPSTNQKGRGNWKIGTPYFMASELQTGERIVNGSNDTWQDFSRNVRSKRAPQKQVVVHNLQHDLESLWWIGFYLGLVKLDHQASLQWCRDNRIFDDKIERAVNSPRHSLIMGAGIPENLDKFFHPDLNDFMDLWAKLMSGIKTEYQARPVDKVTDKSTYAGIVSGFARALDALQGFRDDWGPIPLKEPAVESKKRGRGEPNDTVTIVAPRADQPEYSDAGPSVKRLRVVASTVPLEDKKG
ncbi:hypothetical protein DFP72DRAFT_1170074 [Ephemerocybe angulata]|uniref:Fungal-type protein kinase domain-containing protein n=1 Tax=Ephemerocybe angulata TaxID=980116 RepID=A0A8H6HZS4_9AGAR|nr:hypothetical protein DFP72DRAFT_1170074 [Tulosesus angulatus]